MNRPLMSWLGIATMVVWAACSSSSGALSTATDAGSNGANDGASSTDTGHDANSGNATGSDGGPSFDPGKLGGLLGGGTDGGAAARDGGLGGGPISQEVVDGCNALCTKEAAANCPNQGTLNDCVVGCRLILNNSQCSTATHALFACETTSPVACDAQGKATLTSCGVEQLSAAACFLQNASDPSLKMPCASYCAGVAAAHCPNDDPTGCGTACPVVGNFIPACNMYWKAYVTCASTAALMCGTDGKANAPACGLQGLAYLVCTAGGVASVTPDGGR